MSAADNVMVLVELNIISAQSHAWEKGSTPAVSSGGLDLPLLRLWYHLLWNFFLSTACILHLGACACRLWFAAHLR